MLQARNRRAFDPQMRIAPVPKPRTFSQVFVADVLPPVKPIRAVNYQNLSVIAHVHLDAAAQWIQGRKTLVFPTGSGQGLKRSTRQPMSPHRIIKQSNLNSRAGRALQERREN